jgi:hypothetical protein
MWLVDETSFACCRAEYTTVGLSVVIFACDQCEASMGGIRSIAHTSLPR